MIGGLEARPRLVATEDIELVAQHQDLDLISPAVPEEKHHQREHATDGEVGGRPELGMETVELVRGGRTVVGSMEAEKVFVSIVTEFSDPTGPYLSRDLYRYDD